MRILVLQGSPKKDGNTATLSKKFLAGFTQHADPIIKEFWLSELHIRPCQGCFACFSTSQCVLQDDMQPIYPELRAADLVVFGAPIYWWHLNAQMKLCIDRMTALLSADDKLPALMHKHIVLIVAYRHAHCAQAALQMFEEFKTWLGIQLTVIEYCSREQHVAECPSKLEEAFDLGKRVALSVGK